MSIPALFEPPVRTFRATLPVDESQYSDIRELVSRIYSTVLLTMSLLRHVRRQQGSTHAEQGARLCRGYCQAGKPNMPDTHYQEAFAA